MACSPAPGKTAEVYERVKFLAFLISFEALTQLRNEAEEIVKNNCTVTNSFPHYYDSHTWWVGPIVKWREQLKSAVERHTVTPESPASPLPVGLYEGPTRLQLVP